MPVFNAGSVAAEKPRPFLDLTVAQLLRFSQFPQTLGNDHSW
jgi:hypothetical protein